MAKVFRGVSLGFEDWLRGKGDDRGFSKTLTGAAKWRVPTQTWTVFDAEGILDKFGVLKDGVAITLISFRSMTYGFEGEPEVVEEHVRGLESVKIKLPSRKQLVRHIATHVMRANQTIGGLNDGTRHRIRDMEKRIQELSAEGKVSLAADWTHSLEGVKKTFRAYLETPEGVREFIQTAESWRFDKQLKQLKYYLSQPEVDDRLLQESLNIVVTDSVLQA